MREPLCPADNAIWPSTLSRYGPSRRNRYIERSQAPESSAFRMWTAARSAPPPFSDGSTKQIFLRDVIVLRSSDGHLHRTLQGDPELRRHRLHHALGLGLER